MTARTYLTFDIGGTKIASAFVTLPDCIHQGKYERDDKPQVQDFQEIPTQADLGGTVLCRRLVDCARGRLKEAAKPGGMTIAGIGIATAGVPDSRNGVILSATDILPGWCGQRVYDAFAAATDIPVHMIGDVGAHGIGEAIFGAGSGNEVVLSLGVGTGIGGALIVNGRLFTGAHGAAGHLGHVASRLGKGFRCSCGTMEGHIEPVASGTGLRDLYNVTLPVNVADATMVPDGVEVARRAMAGEEHAMRTIAASAHALGFVLGGIANTVDPDVVIVSGSVVKAGPQWWDALRSGFVASALPLIRPTPLIEGELGGSAPLIGAAVAAERSFFHA